MISTRDLSLLPDIDDLKALMQSLAMLDAILSPKQEYRYYSFDSRWRKDEMMASMRDGSGDEYFAFFNAAGVILKGFAHESSMSPYANDPPRLWPGVLDHVPAAFSTFLAEPAFSIEDTTFCIWRLHDESSCQRGEIQFPDEQDPDGSEKLLRLLDGNPRTYQAWAQDYYEQPISLAAVEHIYKHRPLTQGLIAEFNPHMSLQALEADMEEIGYEGAIG